MKRMTTIVAASMALMLSASLVLAQGATGAAGATGKTRTAAASATTQAKAAAGAAKTAASAAAKGDKVGATAAAKDAKGAAAATAKDAKAAATSQLDLNTASKADLMKLPGVGDAISDKIVKARPFANKAQLVSKNILTKAAYDKVSALVIAKQSK